MKVIEESKAMRDLQNRQSEVALQLSTIKTNLKLIYNGLVAIEDEEDEDIHTVSLSLIVDREIKALHTIIDELSLISDSMARL